MNNNPQVLSATTMIGDRVISATGEELGDLKELMIDLDNRYYGYSPYWMADQERNR